METVHVGLEKKLNFPSLAKSNPSPLNNEVTEWCTSKNISWLI